MPRPRYSLKALFVIMAVLAVPLGMIVSGERDLVVSGVVLGTPVLFGCIGYLLGGLRGVPIGILIAFIVYVVLVYVIAFRWSPLPLPF